MLRLWKLAFGLLAVLFLLVPMFAILPLAFNDSSILTYPMTGVSMRWFSELVEENIWRRAILNSLIIGLSTAVFASVLGTLAALGLRGSTGRLARFGNLIFLMPMVAPIVVLGVGMQLMFTRLGLNNTYLGVIIAHTVISVPFVVISVSAALAGIDPALERASANLGASPRATFVHVTLPLARPGILAGAIFALATSLDEVVLTLFLGGAGQRTLAREMFAQLRENLTPVIAAVSFVFIVGTVCLGAVNVFLRNSRRFRAEGPAE